MTALASRKAPKPLVGSPLPRIAPPTPARANLDAFREVAKTIGLSLYPWQETAARYLVASGMDGQPLYREVAVIVARRNGKTTLLLPYAVKKLLDGQKVTHVAQTLRLPGEFFRQLVEVFETHYSELIPAKRGISWRAGQEELRLKNGGLYRLVAAGNGAARGLSNDVVMIDELREMEDLGVLAAIRPTVAHSPNRQMFYISNAGTENSACLRSIQARATAEDPSLAYLEWSAAPSRTPDDMEGWLESNPAIGHNPAILEGLEEDYRAALSGGTLPDFETERLCRYQVSLGARIVEPDVYAAQEFVTELTPPMRSFVSIKMDKSLERASAVVAWEDADGIVTLDVHDTTGYPIDVDTLGPDLSRLATENRAWKIAFDPYTDGDLARHIKRAKALHTRQYADGSLTLVRLAAQRKLRIHDPEGVLGTDLGHTIRKTAPGGGYVAARGGDEPITAIQAAVGALAILFDSDRPMPARIH